MRIDYRKNYYCSLCEKTYDKASDKVEKATNGAPLCPMHKQRLRTKVRSKS